MSKEYFICDLLQAIYYPNDKQKAQVALFIARNWKIISTALAVFIPATAALTGKLQPVADAIATANPL